MPRPILTPATGQLPPDRRARRAPVSVVPVVVAVALTVLVFIALSVLWAPPDAVDQYGTRLPYNFKSERGSITLLSSGMLMLAACLAARTLGSVWAERGRIRLLWLALTLIMTYFSIDEVGHFHEDLGDFLDNHLARGPIRTYNDVVVVAYGVLVVPLGLLLWREVLRHPRLLTMLVITGVLYVSTTSVDSLVENTTYASEILEEGIKVCCSTFFALSMLTGLVAVRWLHGAPVPASGRPASVAAALTVWLGVVALMGVIALLVLGVSSGELRVLLTWAAVLPVAALVLSAVPGLEGRR